MQPDTDRIWARQWLDKEIQSGLKRGTYGHSLTERQAGKIEIVGFIDVSKKEIRVVRYTEDHDPREISFTWAEVAKMTAQRLTGEAKARSGAGKNKNGRDRNMTMLAKETETRALTLADYEARIHLYKEQIGIGYIGIGRTLIEAKEARVVPHGQWETWMTETTGLTARQAQRCMQAAMEIKDGSALARLEMSKALMLLGSGLDEETKEEIARKAADEGATVKELRAQIEQQKEALETAQRIVSDETGKATKAKLEALDAKEAAQSMESALREVNEENERLRGQLEGVHEYVADQKAKAADAARREAADEVKKQMDDLRADLAAAEAREEKRAAELERLRNEHQQRAMDDARGLATSTLTGFDLAAAVRAFIGSAGVLPQMGSTLRSCSPQERETIRQNIETVAAWVDSARAALGVYEIPETAFVVR